MDLHSVSLAYYSPTRTTQRVLAAIAEGVGARTLTDVDLTLPDAKTRSVPQSQDDLVLLGAPVYAGRIAATATRSASARSGVGDAGGARRGLWQSGF